MAGGSPQLELYLVLETDDAATCCRHAEIAPRYAGRGDYIGLREAQAAAIERARMVSTSPSPEVGAATHRMFKFSFTTAGIAHYTVRNAGERYFYQPILYKKIYWDRINYGVWHFSGNLPFNGVSTRMLDGVSILYVRGEEIDMP